MGASEKLSSKRLDRLTSLRFVAAFAVFGFHAVVFFEGPVADWLNVFFGQGRSGVTFFFVLSGFTLAWASQPNDTVSGIYRRRFSRIYPSYLVALVFAATLWAILDPRGLTGGLLAPFLLQAWVPDSHVYFAVNVPAWSLSVEAFFYLLFPFLIRALRSSASRTLWIVVGAMTTLTLAFAAIAGISLDSQSLSENTFPVWFSFYFPIARLPEFIIGMALGLLVKRGVVPRIPWSVGIGFAVAAYLAVGIWPSVFGVVAIVVLPFSLLIVAAAQRDLTGIRGPLTSRGALALGSMSYCFYLVHHIFVIRLAQPGVRALGVDGLLALAIALAMGLFAAWALHRFVEKPMEKVLSGRISVTDAAPNLPEKTISEPS